MINWRSWNKWHVCIALILVFFGHLVPAISTMHMCLSCWDFNVCLLGRIPWIERRWWYRFVSLKCLFLLFDIKWDFLGSANRNEWDSSKEADDIAILPTFLIDLVIILYQLFWFACEQFLLIIHAKFRVRSVISDLLIKCHAPRAR